MLCTLLLINMLVNTLIKPFSWLERLPASITILLDPSLKLKPSANRYGRCCIAQYLTITLQWVYNILDGRSEADRVIYSDTDQSNGFVVLPDLKWDGKDLHNLYLVAIVRRKDLLSLRDITNEHIPMLKSVLNKGKVCMLSLWWYLLNSSLVSL